MVRVVWDLSRGKFADAKCVDGIREWFVLGKVNWGYRVIDVRTAESGVE